MKRIWALAGILALLFTACGVLGGGEDTPTPTPSVQASSVERVNAAVAGVPILDFADRVEAIGKSYLTPTFIEYWGGNPPKKFQEEVHLSIVCGQEIAMPHAGLFINQDAFAAVLFEGLTEEQIEELPREAYRVRIEVRLGEERVALEKSSAVRVDELFVVSKVPDALTLTHAQRECNLGTEKFQNLRLYEDVHFINNSGIGNKGFIATANLKDSEDIFIVAVPVNNMSAGVLVVVNRNDTPKILGMAIQALPVNPDFILVVGIDTIFPAK